jgi:nucleoside-diphosphate-sugar epimerase
MSLHNPTAFVTGSAGFVGRHMVKTLELQGYDVFTCDTRDQKDPHDMLDVLPKLDHKFDLVVHCAYLVGGRQTIEGIPMALPYNLSLDAAIAQWALQTQQGRLLYFSSSAAYPIKYQNPEEWSAPMQLQAQLNGGFLPLTEDLIEWDNCEEPDANYGWAKITGERVMQAAMQSGLRCHIVRPFSGFGEDQGLEYPFRALAERAKKRANPFEVWGTGEQIRDWIHISDVIEGSLAVVAADEYRPVNLSTGRGVSIIELAKMMCAEIKHEPAFQPVKEAPTGVHARVGDPERFKSIYTCKIPLEDPVIRIMRWTPSES